ncbi:MAG: succinyl-CoA--3-ketoacid-CoA transferase [Eubacterium sp.]|nr:succinyl-CoA--3-ketoacid-CoA transferase [Eubacterium sp.]
MAGEKRGVNHGTGKMFEDRHAIARRIAKFFVPGDIINLGVGAPLLVGDYIEDGVRVHCENGCIGCGPLVDVENDAPNVNHEYYINAGSQPFNPLPGALFFDSATSYAIIRSRKLKATVLGCFEVAENGDMSNWYSPGKISGMGGAMDLCKAPMVVVATSQCDKKGNSKLVKKCTLPLTCSRKISFVVTEMGVYEFKDGKMYLNEIREGYTIDDIREHTDADFVVSEDLKEGVVY